MDTKIYWLEDFFKVQELEPFDRTKDFVVNARGRKNKNRYLYNLEKVNVFYLNYSPPKWAMEYYQKEFPGEVDNSLFSFIHRAHLDVHIPLLQSDVNVISWGISWFELTMNTVSCAVIDYLAQILRNRNIFLTAWDFDRKRDWGQEAERIKSIMTARYYANNEYLLVNYNDFFSDCISPEGCQQLESKMVQCGIITKKLTDREIINNYTASGQAIFKLIHPGT